MNNFVILDGFKYRGSQRRYTRAARQARLMRATLGRVHVIQSFNYQELRWTLEVIVYPLAQGPGWGSLAELEATYLKDFVSFVDQEGNTFEVVLEGEIQYPFNFSIVDDTHPFTTPLTLRRKLT